MVGVEDPQPQPHDQSLLRLARRVGHGPEDKIGAVDVDRAVARWHAHGCSRLTVSGYVQRLRTFFRFADRKGWCARRPHRRATALAELVQGRTAGDAVFLKPARLYTRLGIYRLVERSATRVPSLAARKITPHTIRHTSACHLLQACIDQWRSAMPQSSGRVARGTGAMAVVRHAAERSGWTERKGCAPWRLCCAAVTATQLASYRPAL